MKNNKRIKIDNEKPITFKLSLILDKDFNKLMESSKNNNTPLTFTKNRINYLEINGIKKTPDMIKIGPPSSIVNINVKIGIHRYENVPFKQKSLSEHEINYKTTDESKMPYMFQFTIKRNKTNMNVTFNLSPKSNKINDLLNFEKAKKEWSNTKIEMKFSGIEESEIGLNIPPCEFNEELIEYYERINYINKKLNLNLTIEEDYEITQEDIDNSKSLCEYIREKKIFINNYSIECIISPTMLKDLIDGKMKQTVYGNDKYTINLLNNKIELGKFEIKLNNTKYLNLNELKEIYEKNKETSQIKVQLYVGSDNSDELYLDFNI